MYNWTGTWLEICYILSQNSFTFYSIQKIFFNFLLTKCFALFMTIMFCEKKSKTVQSYLIFQNRLVNYIGAIILQKYLFLKTL